MNTVLTDPHKDQPVLFKGESKSPKAGMILIHGRGADAESILTLTDLFDVKDFIYAAPQAFNNTWYPYSFLTPISDNEPGITSGLNKIKTTINSLNEKGIDTGKIFLLGFSQGACLALEYASRYPQKFGGVIGLSGGLIGPDGLERKQNGSLIKTKIFIGCSDIDPHIPLQRVHYTADFLQQAGGEVIKKIYPNLGHTINDDELHHINKIMNEV
ncbi:MAG: dienelactone hydrolase family protein [Ignavibacteriales bacterium]|nr:MAG: dienelactone hydrolase family protein [Ignavibacteriales bacterium]